MKHVQGRALSYALSRISDTEFAQGDFWGGLGLKLYQLRWIIFSANVLFGLTANHLGVGMMLLFVLPMFVMLLFTEWLRKRVSVQTLNSAMIPLDLLLITMAVITSGGMVSDSYLLYIVEVIFICLYLGGKFGFIVAVLSMGLYGTAVHSDLQTEAQWLQYTYRASMILLFAVGVGYLGQQLRKQVVLGRKMAEENRRLAYTDLLTELGNSRLLYEELDGLLADFNNQRTPFSLLMFDCDNLKQVNDCYGHDAGDMLISHVADCAREVFEPAGTVYRYAGDEFYVLFAHVDAAAAIQLAEQFIEQLSQHPLTYDENQFSTSASVGMVHFIQSLRNHFTRVDAIRLADQALYESKNKGKACLTTYRVCA